MRSQPPQPTYRAYQVIQELLSGVISVERFCSNFEQLYNFDIERAVLPNEIAEALSRLFEAVVWYSPLAEERRRIPNYVDEDSVYAAAREAAARLSHHAS
jgi:hypothetical protein